MKGLEEQYLNIVNVENEGNHAAFQVVKNLAHKHHSLRMAAMAAMIQTATEGHFDGGITSVDM